MKYLLLLFSHPIMSSSFLPHGLQHARPPCPSKSPKVCPSSCPFHQWCHPAISSSDAIFSFCPQSFPASGTLSMSQLFTSDDQNIGASASASVLPMNIQDWFPLDWLVWSPCCPRDFQESFPAPQFKAPILWCSAFFTVQLSQLYMITGKTIALTIWTFVCRVMSLLFNTLSRFVIAFLPKSNHLLISGWQSPTAVILNFLKLNF